MRTLLLFFLGFFGKEVCLPPAVQAQSSCVRRWQAVSSAGDRAWRLAPLRKREKILDLSGTASAAAESAAQDPLGPLCAEQRLQAAEAVLALWRRKHWLLTDEEMNRFFALGAVEDVDAAIKRAKKE